MPTITINVYANSNGEFVTFEDVYRALTKPNGYPKPENEVMEAVGIINQDLSWFPGKIVSQLRLAGESYDITYVRRK